MYCRECATVLNILLDTELAEGIYDETDTCIFCYGVENYWMMDGLVDDISDAADNARNYHYDAE